MNRAPVLFRVDGTLDSGYESLYRCATFAAALQRRRRPAFFLSRLEPATLAATVKRGGNDWIPADHPAGSTEDLDQIVREIRRLQPAAVVVDSAIIGEDYLNSLRETGTVVVSFDIQAHLAFPSRLVINPLLGPSKEAYEYRRGTQLLLGRRFAPIRPEVRRVRPLRAQEPVQPFRALVALGDDDPHNRSGELAKALLNCPRVARVDVAVRPVHPDLPALRALAEQCPERLAVLSEPGELPPRLGRCHFAITAANSWSLEFACLGIPQFLIVQAEQYWPTAQRLEDEGAAICLGWHASVSPATFRQAVNDLLTDPLERQAMARCGRKLIDGRGLDRLVTGLEMLLTRPTPTTEDVRIAA
jgi:spore coat polysaccharide biosynthesis predicted glycosyltransferase SpsG